MAKRKPITLLAVYARDVYRLGGNIDRGYVVIDVAGYRTIFAVPMSVVVDLESVGVRNLGRFRTLSKMRLALRKLKVRRTS